MFLILIPLFTLVCQLIMVAQSLRLIKTTKNPAWVIIAIVMTVQAVRRSVALSGLDFKSPEIDLSGEILAMVISILALVGLILIGGYFRSTIKLKEIAELYMESDVKFRALVERINDGIVIVQNDSIKFFNNAFASMTGYSPQELSGRGFSALLAVDHSKGSSRVFGRKEDSGVEMYEALLQRRDGSTLQIEANSGTLIHEGIPSTLYVIRDISRRKITEEALRRSERLFSNVFRSSPVGIGISTFEDGRLIEINDAALNTLGYSRQEVIGRTTTELGMWVDPEKRAMMIDMLRNLEFVQNLELRYRKKNGMIGHMLYSAERIEIEGMNFLISMVHDITDIKNAEMELRESGEKYRTLVETAEDGVVLMDMAGRHLYTNTAYYNGLGYVPGDDPNPTGFDIIHPDDIHLLKKGLEVLPVKGTYSLEYRIRHRDGHWLSCAAKCTLIRDPSGKPHRILAIIRDITEKKKLENVLRKSEQLFSTIFRTSPVGIGISTLEDGRFIEVNDAILKKTGYTREEMIGLIAEDLGLWVDTDERSRMLEMVRDNGSVNGMEVKFRTKNGKINDVLFSAETIELEGQRYLLAMVVDITEKKKIETALKESEERYRTLVESTEDGIVLTDIEGRHLFVNSAYCASLGYEPDHDPNPSGLGMVHPDDIPSLKKDTIEMFEKGFITFDYRIRHRDGRWLYKSTKCTVVRDESGKPNSVIAIIRDVTEKKQAEERLHQSEADLLEAQRVAKMGSWRFNAADNSVKWSEELYRIFNVDKSEFGGFHESFLERIHPDDKERVAEANRNARNLGEPFEIEYRITIGNGTVRHIREIGYPVKDTAGGIIGLFGTAQDISDRKAIEEALKNSLDEKTALLKEVHHRVKNNLQIVASLLSLQANQSLNRETIDMLQETKNRVYSMALLHEALYHSGSLAHVDFHKYLRDVSWGLMESYDAKSRGIKVNIHADDIMLPLDQTVPCGLIINELLSNSLKYAFPGGRKGSIDVEVLASSPGNLEVIVRDDGIGLPKDMDISRLSSLGLKLVTSLAAQLKGRVTVESKPGAGTEFRISFPFSGTGTESSSPNTSE